MKRLAVAAALLPFTLAGCASGQTWQVVGLYTDPALPGDLPADVAGAVNFDVRDSRFAGETGCAAISGEFTDVEGGIEFTNVEVAGPGDCSGGARHTHEQLAGLMVDGAAFDVRRMSEYEVLLTQRTDAHEPGSEPKSIRLMLL